jgi:tRNA (guanine37-N1)-methyltransferase
MRIDILTVFPEMVRGAIGHSILKRAQESGLVEVTVHDVRDFTHDRHRSTDDSPFGGGAGMVMKPEPLFEAVEYVRGLMPEASAHVLLMTPQGRRFEQPMARRFSEIPWIVMICGHYEGVDERIREHLVDEEVSIGDYVLTGGELPALVILDAVARLVPGVLGGEESAAQDSFSEGLLEYPHYTRPADFRGWQAPEVLTSGHHAEIAKWRRRESLKRTFLRRPDLLESAPLTKEDKIELENIRREIESKN